MSVFAQVPAIAKGVAAVTPRRRRRGFVRNGRLFLLPTQANAQALTHSRAFSGLGDAGDVVSVSADPATDAELRNRIRNSGGAIVVSNDDSHGALNTAYSHAWQFAVEQLADGRYRITETNYVKYAVIAGLGLGVLLLARAVRG